MASTSKREARGNSWPQPRNEQTEPSSGSTATTRISVKTTDLLCLTGSKSLNEERFVKGGHWLKLARRVEVEGFLAVRTRSAFPAFGEEDLD